MPRTFTITEAHMEAFAKQQGQRFEDEMLAQLRKQFPRESNQFSEMELRQFIQSGIRRAESFNIVLEPDVAHYLELTMVFAPDFEDQAKTAWAQAILLDQ